MVSVAGVEAVAVDEATPEAEVVLVPVADVVADVKVDEDHPGPDLRQNRGRDLSPDSACIVAALTTGQMSAQ